VISRSILILFLSLLAATTLAYLPAIDGAPVWDDDAHLTKPELRSADGLRRIWTDVRATQQYYPLLHSAFWLEHQLWGENPIGYHLINIVLHVLGATLLAILWRRLGLPGAYLAAALFALHPIAVESVAWMSEQKNTLSLVLYLAAALLFLRFQETRRRALYAAATLLFAGALLSKSVTATLPAALLVILWWRRGTLRWRTDVMPLLPWFALSATMAAVTVWVERTLIGAKGEEWAFTLLQRVLLAGRVAWFYFAKLVWPANLIFIYPRWDVDAGVAWQYLYPIAAVLVLIALWLLRKRTRTPLAIALLFGGSIVPALGFINVYPFRYSFVADHFQHLGAMYALAGVATGLTLLARAWPRHVALGAAALLLVTLGVLTFRQSRMYKNEETLYRTTLAKNPACWLCYNNLGLLLLDRDDVAGAKTLFERGLSIRPEGPEFPFGLGAVYEKTGRLEEAAALYDRGLKTGDRNPAAHNNLGNLLRKLGRGKDAIPYFRKAIEVDPNHAEAYNNLGAVLADAGQWQEAAQNYEAALAIRPEFAEARNNLGVALVRLGRGPEAIPHFETALRLKPDYPEAENGLGMALATAGRFDEARAHFETALRKRPDYGRAHFNLGNLLHGMNRLDEAMRHYESARRLEPNAPDVPHRFAVALFQQGRRDEAMRQFERALQLDAANADVRFDYAIALLRSDQRARAIAQLREAVRVQPAHSRAQALLRDLQR
jgi:tetratricopeptide (TPR) repeat protein